MVVKYVSVEVFDAIVSKSQSYIAKIHVGFWAGVQVGEVIALTDGERNVEVLVKRLSYFPDFGDAWFTYGDKLVPQHIHYIVTAGEAVRYYEKFYKKEDVTVCGVVVFEIEPV
jgi:ASC-1-like (ASCH) protein